MIILIKNLSKFLFIILIITTIPINLYSQEKDFGLWTSIMIEKKFKKISFELTGDLRTFNNSTDINRLSLQFDGCYKISIFKAGVGYQFIYFNDIKFNDYQPRQRYITYISMKKSFGNFSFSIRERIQRTIKDERDRINPDGSYDTYRINPEWEWRNKIKTSYNIKKTPYTISLSFESFYSLNDPENKNFNKLRYTIDLNYKLSKQHEISVYTLIDKEINIKNPITTYFAGIAYKYSF